MGRREPINHSLPMPDPIYGNRMLTKFINSIMKNGKKHLARQLVYKAFDRIKEQKKDPIEVFESALLNVGPRVEVRPRRIGGASYQVPVEVRGNRKSSLAIRWLIAEARKRSNAEYKTFDAKLAAELLDASINKGGAVKKREIAHRMAEANKAFAHFRW